MIKNFPTHIGIIMDGNGRWAKKRLLSTKIGHKAGADALQKLISKIESTPIKHITVYAFSTENWKRSKQEVDDLMHLLKNYIKQYISDNSSSNIKIDTIGDLSALPKDLQQDILNLTEISKNKTGLNLHIAINYGGRDEIIRATKKMFLDFQSSNLSIDDISEEVFKSYLDTNFYSDPELIIRTSGEFRLSNFLTWQSAYSEFYFCDKLWPDFTFDDLLTALQIYQKRDRRFGGRV